MAQRAVFIPTLGHALSHSMRKNARSSTLKGKLERLEALSTNRYGHASRHCDDEATNLHDALSAKLWRLIQRELLDPNAARRLKPLRSINVTSLAADPDDEILAEDTTFCDGIEPGLTFEDVEDDLLFEPSQEACDYDSDNELLWDALEDEVGQFTPCDDQLGFGEIGEYDPGIDDTHIATKHELLHDRVSSPRPSHNDTLFPGETENVERRKEMHEVYSDEMILEF